MRQQRQGADGVIAAATPRAEDRDLRCPGIECGEECQLSIGCIFISRKARNGHAGRLKLISVGGAQRIKVADHLVQWEAERSGMSGAAISSNDK